ncbi:Transcriptional regulator [Kibdelosporangium sp. 4NS15]|uniref:Transcriptional regulator n=1 Tax=Kibdelosporangium persicum TaxID=2698649 RepID=A0ABX2F3M5_9PSEU|nr:BTAD domain-containing putative transcriptional regulator [Kibdelosporangium persicum]NRN65935.1 Transcriptional regulator [Kibdelosporangium persicum]
MSSAVRFALLGPLRAWRHGAEIDLGPPQQRLLLALLLVNGGKPVSLDSLVDLLWEDEPPSSAVNVVHRYVGTLRRLFEPDLPTRATGSWLIREAGSYRLAVTAESSDVVEYRQNTARARRLAEAGAQREAVSAYLAGLKLWQGRVAHGVVAPARAKAIFLDLDHEGCQVVCEAADVALECGRAADLVPFLRMAVSLDEYNEAMQARLMRVLAATGNQAAALRTYETIRDKLADDLGVDPGPELTGAFREVLTSPAPDETPLIAPVVRPAQLPPDLPAFAGRSAELRQLESWLPDQPRGLVTIAIDGMPGAGKTTLAVHWAHRVADRFPDGQLYINMRGFDPDHAQLTAAEALRGLLDALGINTSRIPATVDAQSALYRSVLSNRRVLVLIDNAREVADIRPLLPASAGCLVIVTSRNRLAGLVAAEGAQAMTLHALSAEEARETLIRRLGREKVEHEAEAVEEIIALCGRLPLALAIVAARAAAYPHFPLSAIIAKLKQAKGTLQGFRDDDGELDVHTAFSWSYRILSTEAARLFRLLSVHIGAETSVGAAASIGGLPVGRAQALLDELTRIRFLTEHEPGRYLAHDLIRTYAVEQRMELDSAQDTHEALGRLLDYYVHNTYQAYLRLPPHQVFPPPPPPRPGVPIVDIPDQAAALNWFAAERHVIGLLVKTAAEHGFLPYTWYLAITIQHYYQRRGLAHEWESAASTALAAAILADDTYVLARMHRSMAGAQWLLKRPERALEHLKRTEELLAELDDTSGFPYVYSNYGTVLADMGRAEEAAEYHRKALDLYEQTGDRKGQAISLQVLATHAGQLGHNEDALDLADRAMEIYRAIGDRHGEGNSWEALGRIHIALGDHQRAVHSLKQAVEIYREVHALAEAANVLILLGDTMNTSTATREAISAWQTALAIFEELRLPESDEVRARIKAHHDSS